MSLFGDLAPTWLDQELWTDFVEGRGEKAKTKMTERAKKRMLLKLSRFHDQGIDVNECLERSIIAGWKDIYEPKKPTNQSAEELISNRFAAGYRLDIQD